MFGCTLGGDGLGFPAVPAEWQTDKRQAERLTDDSGGRGESICVFKQWKSSKNNIAENKAGWLSEEARLSVQNRLIHVIEKKKYQGSRGDPKRGRGTNSTTLKDSLQVCD